MSRKQRNVEHAMTPNPNTIEIPKFNGQNLDIISWLKFFNKKCLQKHLDEDFKLNNISNYLEGEAFSYYIEELQDINNWGEIEQKLTSYFTINDSNLFSRFLNLKYNDNNDLEQYFKEKSALANKLNLEKTLLLEALTDGMPDHLKKYLIAARVQEPSEWYKITTQLKLSTNKEEEPQQPSTSTSTPVKKFNSNSSKAQYQPFPRTAAATHHQQEPHKPINLPPYPCKICASHQLPNQIHFHRDCPLKNNNHPKRINPDASSLGVAGVLKQPDEQGILHPIGYFSRKLHPYEQNYTASEIETLAIINSVQRFHTYLHNIHFTLHTDHLPLKWIKNVKNPQAFLSRKFKHFLDRNNVKHLLTSSHHPETNAKVERLNSTIINRLRCEYNANLKIPWTKYIPKITESYNETVHTTTGFTPKFLYYGIQPQYIEHCTETHTPIEKARKLAIERTIKSHEHSKQLYDIKHPEPIFKEGDQSFQSQVTTITAVATGRPDLFVTFTCNPRWTDIVENLLPNQNPSDRPDLVARVFNLKLQQLLQMQLHCVRAVGKIVIPLASTGIAATLLSGGQTVHSRFKLPIPLLENSVAAISANSSEAELIHRSSLIIWDEAPMAHYRALEIVDRLLKDIMHCDLAFGGKVVVLGGDFRQVLPVVPRASRAEIVAACIKQSKLWPLFVILRLTQNMRAGIDAQSFSQWLLKVGDGDLPTDQQGLISLPESCIFHGVDLVQEIFGSSYGDITALSQSVILTPKNTDSLEINEKVLDRLPNRSQCFLSVDSVECENVEEQNNYPTEFLNSLTPTGMPPHRLNLKIGAIVMLLRNLNPKQGLCNGTRMVIQRMRSHVLEAQILTGTKVGQTVLVPKISLAPSDTNLPFILKRRQFPLRLAFAMTINKAQGQTFARVGLLLHEPVFTHGQLYVAFSRVRTLNSIRGYGGAASVLMLESETKASIFGMASNHRQSQTFTKVCLDHGAMINESCTPIPHSMRSWNSCAHVGLEGAATRRGKRTASHPHVVQGHGAILGTHAAELDLPIE
ncbi:hypothetical protein LAZ67_14000604 [Cordylochernes scorpioides]|uniref:ATP-dependent DNA helicase n=1 Tax=Cordylochernes scorpioides TaxID=51811 RepID=A0ABY6LAJ7_9ARAC|nr:hypothetical protein LAZ67_14000604 [Cordylochernes scorpioides]